MQNEKGIWIERNTQEKIGDEALEELEPRFAQSKGTPFLVSPFVVMVGFLGDIEEAYNILYRKLQHRYLLSDTMSEIEKELK